MSYTQQQRNAGEKLLRDQLAAMNALPPSPIVTLAQTTDSIQKSAARHRLEELYETTWPDTWPDNLKLEKTTMWVYEHKDMTFQSMYEALMSDAHDWGHINTLLCTIPPNPSKVNRQTALEYYEHRVPWAGAMTAWSQNPRVLQRGIIQWSEIAQKWNRALQCPAFELRLTVNSATTKIGDKLQKVSEFQDKVLEGAGNLAQGAGKVAKAVGDGADDNPLLSFGSVIALGGLTIGLLIVKSSGVL